MPMTPEKRARLEGRIAGIQEALDATNRTKISGTLFDARAQLAALEKEVEK